MDHAAGAAMAEARGLTRLIGGQGLAARYVPNAWWLQVVVVIVAAIVFGVLVHVAFKSFASRRRAKTGTTSTSRYEKGSAAIAGAAVCLAVLVIYFSLWHTNTRLLGSAGVIELPKGSTYVAMGDSYAAGEGLAPYNPRFICHQSIAGAFATRLTFTPSDVHRPFVACSGATLADIALNVVGSDLPRANCSGTGAAQVCEPRQLPRAQPEHSVALTTIFISGNDADWSSVVPFCATHLDCKNKPYQNGTTLAAWATARLTAIHTGLDQLFPLLKRDLTGRIVVLGYPPLFGTGPRAVNPICEGMAGVLPRNETDWFRTVEQQLDADINQAATAAHLEYIATDVIFTGHEPCSTDPWINALVGGDLNKVLHGDINKLVGNGSFHPNNNGQLAFSTIVSCYLHEHKNPPTPTAQMSTAGDQSDATLGACVTSELHAKGVPTDTPTNTSTTKAG
jgi:lysophospholipase L1-like esterase